MDVLRPLAILLSQTAAEAGAEAESASGGLGDALILTFVGLFIVFAVLGLIAVIVHGIGLIDQRWQEREKTEAIEQLSLPPTIDHTTLVLISAAVAALRIKNARVRSVRRLAPSKSPAWSSQGRAVLVGSHRIDRHR